MLAAELGWSGVGLCIGFFTGLSRGLALLSRGSGLRCF
jgi:hypothetical protein